MKWRVTAWITAPGDFPERLLTHTVVEATTLANAVRKAEHSLALQLDPFTVQATRIQPPVNKETP